MFGPSGERTGSILEYCEELTSRMEKLALSRFIPPGPKTETRLRLSISERGFVSSRMVESWLLLKNSLSEAIRGLALIKVAGRGLSSGEIRLIFSFTERSILKSPTLKALTATSSPTLLRRLFERWSISSTLTPSSAFWRRIRYLRAPTTSWRVRIQVDFSLGRVMPSLLFILNLPTLPKS